MLKRNVFCYSDFLSFQEPGPFFRFLHHTNVHDIISCHIMNGAEPVGIISFLRSRHDLEFSSRDKERMMFLSRYISNLFLMMKDQHESDALNAALDCLSDRELEISLLLMRGATYHEISKQLYISVNTVKSHVKNIFGKLHVKSKAELSYLLSPLAKKM